MTISLTLTVEILLGKENDRHLLTSTPLLSQKNPQERRPPETCLAQMPSGPGLLRCQRSWGQLGGEARRPRSIHSFVHPTTLL